MIRKLTTTNGKYNMGLLDYLNKGFDNSVGHLNNLKDSFANQPKMYDPHANAQALMGGQAMQYNQQPQSLIADTPQVNNQVSNAPTNITPQQTQQVTYGAPVGPNMGQVNTETSEAPSLTIGGYDPTQVDPRNPAINQPMVGSLLMGNAQQQQGFQAPESEPTFTTQVDNTDYSKQGVNSMTPVVAQQYPEMNLGEAFRPTIDPAEMARREEAKRKLQAMFGGKL
jgi:hypothetical protein